MSGDTLGCQPNVDRDDTAPREKAMADVSSPTKFLRHGIGAFDEGLTLETSALPLTLFHHPDGAFS